MTLALQEITCVLDPGSHGDPVISENGFTGRQCAECGLIFVSPRPTREAIDEIYEQGRPISPPTSSSTAPSMPPRCSVPGAMPR